MKEPSQRPTDSLGRRSLIKHGLTTAAGFSLMPFWPARGAAPVSNTVGASESPFGHWRYNNQLPEFVYTADHESLPEAQWDPIDRPPSRRHFHMSGNRALQMQVANDGSIALFDESEGMRWLVYGDDNQGTGYSLITEQDGLVWGSDYSRRPPGDIPERIFGGSYFEVATEHEGLALRRTVLCPEGDVPWLLVRVELALDATRVGRRIKHTEQWQLRPHFLQTWQPEAEREKIAAKTRYRITSTETSLIAKEDFSDAALAIGEPAELILERALSTPAILTAIVTEGNTHPLLQAESALDLKPGQSRVLWFRFGRAQGHMPEQPRQYFSRSLQQLAARLPRSSGKLAGPQQHEIPWHAAVLSGAANRDRILGGHTLNQGSVYGFGLGANAAARDSLQHALPLVYSEPELALSVLRNTCSWGMPDGDLPYALDGNKQPITNLFRPSDQNLWCLWLAAEYAAVTGNLHAFEETLPFHPSHSAKPVTLKQHLIGQFRFFVDQVGRGAGNHVRILNADWNDMAIDGSGVDRQAMIAEGGSVLNSAMASWVFSVFAGLLEKLQERELAREARQQAEELRLLVARSWNGRWFNRAYAPDGKVVGETRCWLEVQPWAILCGAADEQQARQLLAFIDGHHRADSPLGARVIWPTPTAAEVGTHGAGRGQGTKGGIWYSINMTLVWAASKIDPGLARDEWRRMSLANHTSLYPGLWEGTLSGPDAWNSPEADRPGQTWSTPRFSMQSFPVNNLHAHAQPVFAYLRLLGVEPLPDGSLKIGNGSSAQPGGFHSATLSVNEAGHGWLKTQGRVSITRGQQHLSGSGGKIDF